MTIYNVATQADIDIRGWRRIEADSPEDAAEKYGPLLAVDYFDDGWEDHVGECATILVQDGDASPVHEIAVKYVDDQPDAIPATDIVVWWDTEGDPSGWAWTSCDGADGALDPDGGPIDAPDGDLLTAIVQTCRMLTDMWGVTIEPEEFSTGCGEAYWSSDGSYRLTDKSPGCFS